MRGLKLRIIAGAMLFVFVSAELCVTATAAGLDVSTLVGAQTSETSSKPTIEPATEPTTEGNTEPSSATTLEESGETPIEPTIEPLTTITPMPLLPITPGIAEEPTELVSVSSSATPSANETPSGTPNSDDILSELKFQIAANDSEFFSAQTYNISDFETQYGLTYEDLLFRCPIYLDNITMETFLEKRFNYGGEIWSDASVNEDTAKLMHNLKQGVGYQISELIGQTGITETEHEKYQIDMAKQVVKDYLKSDTASSSMFKEVADNLSTIDKVYNINDQGVQFIDQMLPACPNLSRDCMESTLQAMKTAQPLMKYVNDTEMLFKLSASIIAMEEIDVQAIEVLIESQEIMTQDNDIYVGLCLLKEQLENDPGAYVLANYCTDKVINALASELVDYAATILFGSSTIVKVVTILAKTVVGAYEIFNPSYQELQYTTICFMYYMSATSTVKKWQKKFKAAAQIDERDMILYEAACNLRFSCLRTFLISTKACTNSGNKQRTLQTYCDNISNTDMYGLYIGLCMKRASEALVNGTLELKEVEVIYRTNNGTVIDENYDSKESITAKFAIIQNQFVPNVGQTWTGDWGGATQCFGFARMIFAMLFGCDMPSQYYGNAAYQYAHDTNVTLVDQLVGSEVTADNIKTLLSNGSLGDIIQGYGTPYGQHTMVLVGTSDSGATVYQCNMNGECGIYQSEYSWTWLASRYGMGDATSSNGLSLYHADNYSSIYGDGSDLFYDDSVNFVISDGVLTKYNGWQKIVTIPDTVTSIGANAFKNNTTMISVTIPDSVTSIGASAFYGCTSLVGVIIPDSVESIGNSAFYSCSSMVTIQLSNNIKFNSIKQSTFDNCKSLKSIEIPDNIVKITESAFARCSSVEEIYIPKSLQQVETVISGAYIYGVFEGCNSIRSITFEEGITAIPNNLFCSCSWLTEIDIPNTVTDIGSSAFKSCVNLKRIVLPTSLQIIKSYAFSRCEKIENIEFPDSVTRINEGAFSDCVLLKKILLPKKITQITESAFARCSSVEEIYIPKSLQQVETVISGAYIYGVFEGCNSIRSITFEEGITAIPNNLFCSCSWLTEIDIPNTVTDIGSSAFKSCVNLKRIVLPTSLQIIKSYAFSRCEKIENIEFPDSVTRINEGAFSDCVLLKKILLPKKITQITESAFARCSSVEEIYIPKSLQQVETVISGAYIYGVFEGCNSIRSITFEEGITAIPNNLFCSCSWLTEIDIPNTVTDIGSSAFKSCVNLKRIVLPTSLQIIKSYAFEGCSSLKEVYLPNSITEMSENIFKNCTSLETVHIPESRINLPANTFYGCIKLKEVNLAETLEAIRSYAFYNCDSLQSITLPSKVTTIETYAFNDCDTLETVVIPDSVTSIGNYAFNQCDILRNVTLGTGITAIPQNSFSNCGKLEEIVLPYRVTSIGANAFANDTSFKKITIPRSVTSIASSVFSYPGSMTIYGISGTYAESFANANGIAFVNSNIPATAVSVLPEDPHVNKNAYLQLTLSIVPSNFTDEVTWKSANTSIATVDSSGKVKGVGVGTTTIKVFAGNISKSTSITVNQPVTSISVSPYSKSLEAGKTLALSATVYPSDATNKAFTWSSSNEIVASVDENGVVQALTKGTARITATASDGSGVNDYCDITVTSNLYQITDVGDFECSHPYTSNCSDIWEYKCEGARSITLTFSNETEVEEDFDFIKIFDVNSKLIGSYTGTSLAGKSITVTGDIARVKLESDSAGSCYGFKITDIKVLGKEYPLSAISLNKSETSLEKGASETLTVTYVPDNTTDSKMVTWSSSNTKIVTVENGVVTAVGAGDATIQAKVGTKTATCNVTVTAALQGIELDHTQATLEKNSTTTLRVSFDPIDTTDNKNIIWTSSNASILEIDPIDGTSVARITGLTKGTASVTAKVGTKEASCDFEVINPIIDLSISSEMINLTTIGEEVTLTPIIEPSDADIATFIWSSADDSIATVTSEGVVTAVNAGSTTITVRAGSHEASCRVIMTPEEIEDTSKLILSPADATLSKGTSIVLQPIDFAAQPVTTELTYRFYSNEEHSAELTPQTNPITGLLTVLGTDNKPIVTLLNGTVKAIADSTDKEVYIRATNCEDTAVSHLTVQVPAESIILNRSGEQTLKVEETLHLSAIVSPANVDDDSVTWSSSNAQIARVDGNGLVTGICAGHVVISAKTSNGKIAELPISVTKKIEITQITLGVGEDTNIRKYTLYTNGTTEAGDTYQNEITLLPNPLEAEGTYQYTSSNETIATVDSTGKVNAVGIGHAVITVTDAQAAGGKGVFATCQITVKTKLDEINTSIRSRVVGETDLEAGLWLKKGASYTVAVTLAPQGASDKTLLWTSEDPAIATVTNKGVIKGIGIGSTVITVSNGTGEITREIPVTVSSATITKAVKLYCNETEADITLSRTDGTTCQMRGEGYADTVFTSPVTTGFTYNSSNNKIATVNASGLVTAVGKGTATITATATDGSNKSASRKITIVEPVETITLSKLIAYVLPGKSTTVAATVSPATANNKSVTWSIDRTDYFSITTAGKITAQANTPVGTIANVVARATDGSGVEGTCQVEVIGTVPSSVTLDKKSLTLYGTGTVETLTEQLTATIKPDSAAELAEDILWTSSDETILRVDENGLVRVVGYGKATVTVALADHSKNAACTITAYPINKSLKISAVNQERRLQMYENDVNSSEALVIKDSNGTILAPALFTYTSADTAIVVVKEDGTIVPNPAYTGATDGKVTVTAVLTGDLSKRKVSFNVSVVKLALDKSKATLYVNGDDTTENKRTFTLSAQARNVKPNWTTTDENVATVDALGHVTAVGTGTAVITATDDNGSGKFANCEVIVRKQVEEIQVEDTLTLQKGKSYTPAITVTPADASDQQLTYSSSDATVATVDKKGKITAKGEGTATVNVTNAESGIVKPITVTVESRTISLMFVSVKTDGDNTVNDPLAMNPGDRIALQASAFVKETDGTKTLLTDRRYTWTSSNAKVATVEENGIVWAVSKGTVTITATATDGSGKKATQAVKVWGPAQSVTLNKSHALMKAGTTEKLKATVLPSNADNKTVNFTMSGTDTSYFTLNAKTGELKAAKTAPVGTQITVTASHAVNSECSASCTVEIVGKPVTALSLNTKAVNLTGLGVEYELLPTFKPLDADEAAKTLIWSSADETVVTVSGGMVRTCGYGKTSIIASTRDGVCKATCTVTVYPIDKDYKLSAVTATQYIQIYEKDVNSGCNVAVKDQFDNVLDADKFEYSSSNKQIAVVDDYGYVTPNPSYMKDGTVTITAVLKNDPAARKVTFTVKLLKTEQTECIRITKKQDDNRFEVTDHITKAFTKGDVLVFSASAYNSKDESITAKVRWTVSDTSMAKVTTNKDGTVNVTIQKEGRFELQCTAQDTWKRSASVSISTLSGTPKISTGTLTLNQYETEGNTNAFIIWESNGSEIVTEQSAIVSGKIGRKELSAAECEKFSLIQNVDGTYALKISPDYYQSLSKGTYSLKLKLVGDGIEALEEQNEVRHEYFFNISLKVVNTMPVVKITSPSINLFYQGAGDRKQLIKLVSPEKVTGMEAVSGQSNSFDNYFDFSCDADGNCYVEFIGDNSYTKSSLKGNIRVALAGYNSITASIVVNTPNKAPSYSLSKTISLDANTGVEATTSILNSSTKEVYSNYQIVANSNPKLAFRKAANGDLCVALADGVSVKNNESIKAVLQIKDMGDTWKQPVSIIVTAKAYTTTAPKVVTSSSSFTLNLAASLESVASVIFVDRSNLSIMDDGEWNITVYDKVTKSYLPCEDLLFDYNKSSGLMSVKLKPNTSWRAGKYTVRVAGMIEGYETITKDFTVTLVDKEVKATVKTSGTIDLVNRSQKYLQATVSLSNTTSVIRGVSLQSEDYYPVLTGDKTFTIRLKQSAVVKTAKVTVPVKLTLEGGTVIHTTVTFTPMQSTPIVKVPAAQTIYKSGKVSHADYDLQEKLVQSITIDHITPVSMPSGFYVSSTKGKVTVHLINQNVKPGNYSIKVNSYFTGAQTLFGYSEGKPVTSVISVKIAE